jgi:hypothetical protein
MGSHFLDPNEDCAQSEICVANFATHGYYSVTVWAGVLVKEISKGIKLLLDGQPGLIPLRRSKLRGCLLGLRPHEVSTAALREPEVSHRDHDGQKRFGEDFLNVVDEEALHSARSFGEDWSSRVRVLEILGDAVGVGERLIATRVEDNGESVNWTTIGTLGRWRNFQLA